MDKTLKFHLKIYSFKRLLFTEHCYRVITFYFILGQKFGLLQMKSVLCGILRNFILQPIDTPDEIVFTPHVIIKTRNDIIRVKFVSRHRE